MGRVQIPGGSVNLKNAVTTPSTRLRTTGFPGYDTLMQKDTASVGEILKQRGWNTMWCGT